MTEPVLLMPGFPSLFTIFTNASDKATGAVLCQDKGSGLQPVAYLSTILSPAEQRFSTYDQEMLAALTALKQWKYLIQGVTTTVVIDHQALINIKHQSQAHWLHEISELGDDIEIIFKSGKSNLVADALDRRSPEVADILNENFDDSPALMEEGAENEDNLTLIATISSLKDNQYFKYQLMEAYLQDPVTAAFIQEGVGPSQWTLTDQGYILAKSSETSPAQLVIPNDQTLKLKILQACHGTPIAGHLGSLQTLHTIQRLFTWTGLAKDVATFVPQCSTCQQTKASTQKPAAFLQP